MRVTRPPDTLEPRSLDDGIAEYLLACEIEGKSPRTVQAYGETLRLFRRVCGARDLPAALADFRPAHIYQFLKAVQDSGVSIGTRHRRFRETRTRFSWALRMGYCARNPFAGIPNVRLEQKVIQPYTPEEVQALLEICDPETAFGCRNRAIILLLLDTGIRASELLQLTLADIQWADHRVHIRWGKGRKQRVVPLGDRPAAAVRDYIDRFRGEEVGCVFLSSRGPRVPLAPFSLVTLFDRLGRRWASTTCTPTASATRSRRGRSRTRPGSSTSSTCSGTPPRRWCDATRRPTTRRKRPPPIRGSARCAACRPPEGGIARWGRRYPSGSRNIWPPPADTMSAEGRPNDRATATPPPPPPERAGLRTLTRAACDNAILPGVLIMLFVLAANFMGDRLRDVLDPRLRGSR